MTKEEAEKLINILTDKGVQFETGLNNKEVRQIELRFNLKFPPDLKLFLQTALPISDEFVNWRKGLTSEDKTNEIISRLNWPLEGMLFDIKENKFWIKSWGKQPKNFYEQTKIAKKHYLTFPKLIPIYSHRFIPSTPDEKDNPIFSVYQMDIIYHGYNIASYFADEFKFTLPSGFKIIESPKPIFFWSDWIENEDDMVAESFP